MGRKLLMLYTGLLLFSACILQEKRQAINNAEVQHQDQAYNLLKTVSFPSVFNSESEGLEIKLFQDSLIQETVYAINIYQQPAFIYAYSFNLPLKRESFSPGDKLLLQIRARTLEADYSESGEGKLKFIFGISANRKKWIHKIISITTEWDTYYIPVEIKEALPKGSLKLKLQLGFPPQHVLITQPYLIKYNAATKMETLPKTNIRYSGMDPDAIWREEAVKRIEKYRKSDFKLSFQKDGEKIIAVPVKINLKKHHFRWGATVMAKKLVTDPQYKNHLIKYFNQVTFANDLKIKHWQRWKTYTEQAFELLEMEQIPVKGHVLIWPGFRHLTSFFEENKNDPPILKLKMEEHLDEILAFTRGKVDRWDVTNETYTNNDLQRILGSEEILYEGFRKLYKSQPEVLRFTNEFAIISRGGIYREKQKWYKDYIRRVDERTGGLVDGIGIQCHMGTAPTGIEKVYHILDEYAELGKMIGISEFTMTADDEEIRYRYTKDFMTIAFSHPAVHEFVFWGMNVKDNWKADLFTENWQLGSMGKAYTELVHDKWTTSVNGQVDKDGIFRARGFYGTYDYQLNLDGEIYKGEFKIFPGLNQKIEINL